MAIEAPFCYHDALRRNSSSALPSHNPSSSSSLDNINMRANPPASSPCNVPPSSCTNSHETVVSIDRAGMVRSASLRPSRGVTPIEHTPTVSTTTGTLPTLTTAAISPLVPTRGSPTIAGAPNARRLSLLSSGFWVSVELFFTLSQILAAIVVLAVSQNERPETPLPVWVIGYAVGCSATLPLLYWRYHHHPPIDNFLEQAGNPLHHHNHHHHHHHHHHVHQQSTPTPWSPSSSMPISYPSVTHLDPHDPTAGRVYPSITRVRIELCMERLRMTLDCFFAVWFVLGNVWVFGRPSAAQESPKLYRLCVAFLALSCMSYAMPFVVCAAVCCCLPCLISLLGFGEGSVGQGEGRGASVDTIAALPIFHFRSKRSTTKQLEKGLPSYNDASSDSECSSEGGVMGAGTQHERVIAGDDAACCICLGRYRDNAQLRGLPCSHHFHVECLDQWLKINASCPLCKFSLQAVKNGEGDGDVSSAVGRRGRRLFEEV